MCDSDWQPACQYSPENEEDKELPALYPHSRPPIHSIMTDWPRSIEPNDP
jgi:hypothetical protein